MQAEQKEVPQNAGEQTSRLAQWPVQIKLVPVNAPYFENAQLLIAADCTAYAYAGFHEKFMKDHVTLIGCPKLDEGDYADKLAEIIGIIPSGVSVSSAWKFPAAEASRMQ